MSHLRIQFAGSCGKSFCKPRAIAARPSHDGGTYVNMEGPAFSTRAESLTNHASGYDVIGMTNLGEAKCAREAEIAYATMAMSTDYDCWKTGRRTRHARNDHRQSASQRRHRKKNRCRRHCQNSGGTKLAVPFCAENAFLTDQKFWPKKTVNRVEADFGEISLTA
jgi:5'-methylthioadenosine phosphorylase